MERLVAAKLTGHAVDDETARWLAALDNILYGRLANVGLVPPRATASPVAEKHYLQMTDDHFERAIQSGAAAFRPVLQRIA